MKQECLDHFLVFGEQHLNFLVREYVSYYNSERAHSCRDHLPPSQLEPPHENNAADPEATTCQERLVGLIKTFARTAA